MSSIDVMSCGTDYCHFNDDVLTEINIKLANLEENNCKLLFEVGKIFWEKIFCYFLYIEGV